MRFFAVLARCRTLPAAARQLNWLASAGCLADHRGQAFDEFRQGVTTHDPP
jgi:hypothetical protein